MKVAELQPSFELNGPLTFLNTTQKQFIAYSMQTEHNFKEEVDNKDFKSQPSLHNFISKKAFKSKLALFS